MAKGERREVFEDFAGGERGLLPSWRGAKNSWTGRNVIPTVAGTLIPRSGLVDLAKTSVPTGALAGLGWADGGAGSDKAWFAVGTSVRTFDPYTVGGAVTTTTGALSATPTRIVAGFDEAGFVWLTNYNDRVYKLDVATNTLTALANTAGLPAGRCIVAWNAFLITGGGPTNPARIYWSDGVSFDAWPAAPNFVAIGSLNSAVTGLFALRNQLVVAKDDGTWWVVTGDLSTSTFADAVFTVHQVYSSQIPLLEPQAGAVISGQAVWFAGRSAPYPSWFNGSAINSLEYLDPDIVPAANVGTTPVVQVCRLTGPNELLIAAGSTGVDRLLYRGQSWSKHGFGITGLEWTAPMADGLVLVSDGGSVGVAAKFYVWNATSLERPPNGANTLESITDAGTVFDATVELPEWISDRNSEVLVRAAIVDFERYDQGAAAPPQQFDCTVTATRRTRDTTGSKASAVGWWSGAARTAQQDRAIFMVGDQGDGAGFFVTISNMRGVAIQRVTALIHDESERTN